MPTALITGISGQDGYYLSQLLLEKDYRVFGFTRRVATDLQTLLRDVELFQGDLRDRDAIQGVLERSEPDEIYNLAGISFLPFCETHPELAEGVNVGGVANLLSVVIDMGLRDTRFYQASSSEMFGRSQPPPYNEDTKLLPESEYARSKVAAHELIQHHRERHGIFAVSGILFNHESPRRPPTYVTRKVTQAAAAIRLGHNYQLRLGDLSAKRDWGFAGNFVHAMWLMLQQNDPKDFVIATGQLHSVEDLVRTAFAVVGIEGWEQHVTIDSALVRPAELHAPLGDASRARSVLGWRPSVTFKQMIQMMVEEDMRSFSGVKKPGCRGVSNEAP